MPKSTVKNNTTSPVFIPDASLRFAPGQEHVVAVVTPQMKQAMRDGLLLLAETAPVKEPHVAAPAGDVEVVATPVADTTLPAGAGMVTTDDASKVEGSTLVTPPAEPVAEKPRRRGSGTRRRAAKSGSV